MADSKENYSSDLGSERAYENGGGLKGFGLISARRDRLVFFFNSVY